MIAPLNDVQHSRRNGSIWASLKEEILRFCVEEKTCEVCKENEKIRLANARANIYKRVW